MKACIDSKCVEGLKDLKGEFLIIIGAMIINILVYGILGIILNEIKGYMVNFGVKIGIAWRSLLNGVILSFTGKKRENDIDNPRLSFYNTLNGNINL